jgi:hypothetical protein
LLENSVVKYCGICDTGITNSFGFD